MCMHVVRVHRPLPGFMRPLEIKVLKCGSFISKYGICDFIKAEIS